MIMSKLAPTSTKYLIKAKIKADGIIEKPDVIGAVFGQTEGLLGSELDLRELQRSGRIGRIEVEIKSEEGKSEGEIQIPSSMDASETAMIAATLETIDRIGPCKAKIELLSVEDMRSEKRKYVIDKAKDILRGLVESGMPDTEAISEEIKEAVRTQEISSYQGLPAGPNLMDADSIIIVEGRADIVTLLKFGIRNTIAVEGTSIPQAVADLIKEKSATLFVDGDRGGQLIAKEMMQKAPEIDFIAMAPEGKEVEDLTKKEVFKSLRDKIPADQFRSKFMDAGSGKPQAAPSERFERAERFERRERSDRDRPHGERRGMSERGRGFRGRPGFGRRPEESAPEASEWQRELFRGMLEDIAGTKSACILDDKGNVLGRVPVSELEITVNTLENPYAIVLDGKVNAGLNFLARRKGVKFLVGNDKDIIRTSVRVMDRKDLGK